MAFWHLLLRLHLLPLLWSPVSFARRLRASPHLISTQHTKQNRLQIIINTDFDISSDTIDPISQSQARTQKNAPTRLVNCCPLIKPPPPFPRPTTFSSSLQHPFSPLQHPFFFLATTILPLKHPPSSLQYPCINLNKFPSSCCHLSDLTSPTR